VLLTGEREREKDPNGHIRIKHLGLRLTSKSTGNLKGNNTLEDISHIKGYTEVNNEEKPKICLTQTFKAPYHTTVCIFCALYVNSIT